MQGGDENCILIEWCAHERWGRNDAASHWMKGEMILSLIRSAAQSSLLPSLFPINTNQLCFSTVLSWDSLWGEGPFISPCSLHVFILSLTAMMISAEEESRGPLLLRPCAKLPLTLPQETVCDYGLSLQGAPKGHEHETWIACERFSTEMKWTEWSVSFPQAFTAALIHSRPLLRKK